MTTLARPRAALVACFWVLSGWSFFGVGTADSRADVLDSLDTSVSAWDNSYSQTLTWVGSQDRWTWAPSYGLSWSRSSVEGEDSTWTHRFKLSGGHRFPHFFEANLDFSYSVKPATDFSALGPGVEIARRFEGKTRERSLRVALKAGMMAYHQKTYAALLKLYPRLPSAVNLLQNTLGAKARGNATRWFSGGVGYQHYFYNRSVKRLLEVMSSPRAVRSGASRLGDQVGSFYSDLVDFSAGFYFLERWTVDLAFSVERLASEEGWGETWSLTPGFELGFDWTLTAGFERITEPGYQQNSMLIGVSYHP